MAATLKVITISVLVKKGFLITSTDSGFILALGIDSGFILFILAVSFHQFNQLLYRLRY